MDTLAALPPTFAPALAVALVGYLLGSLPFGYLVARAHGINIFEVGSKNPGATNVKRVLGAGPGNTVFALDALKGAAASAIPLAMRMDSAATLALVGLASSILGHSFSCFTRLRGGKGVATAAGGLAVVLPIPTAIAGLVWVVAFYASRYVSLASILAAVALPSAVAALRGGSTALWVSAAVAAFVIFRHRANISRLMAGTEKRFERRKAGGA